ncbi:MAG TPA: hypothetical protein VKB80_13200 [Kofleriaceae bacterium]|nr:hypothetical protein [Kofleriaceae bacterium]
MRARGAESLVMTRGSPQARTLLIRSAMSVAFGARVLIALVGWVFLLAIVVWSLGRSPAGLARRPSRSRSRAHPARLRAASGSIAEVYHRGGVNENGPGIGPRMTGAGDPGAPRELWIGAARRRSWPLATRPPAWN